MGTTGAVKIDGTIANNKQNSDPNAKSKDPTDPTPKQDPPPQTLKVVEPEEGKLYKTPSSEIKADKPDNSDPSPVQNQKRNSKDSAGSQEDPGKKVSCQLQCFGTTKITESYYI